MCFAIHKFGGYTVDRNHDKYELVTAAKAVLDEAKEIRV
jgi:maltose phosphorylase